MTLFDIFYQHTEWWCNPDLGHDTQGKYGDVLKEMEDCALDYARSIKDTGDRWKRVIENETRELCRPNHYSWNLRGDKKEWHDTVVSDFLIRIRKAIEHCYGYNFTELPKNILPSYGIYCYEWPTNRKPQQKHTEAPQQPIGGNSGELAGNGNESAPEDSDNGSKYIELPLSMQTDDKRAEKVFTEAVNKGWLQVIDNQHGKWIGFARTKDGKIKNYEQSLAWLIVEIYDPERKGIVNWSKFEEYFNISDLSKHWGNALTYYNRTEIKRDWQSVIDKLIKAALQ